VQQANMFCSTSISQLQRELALRMLTALTDTLLTIDVDEQ